jgi:hypothetical protein
MNIKEKIIEWKQATKEFGNLTRAKRDDIDYELEMVLFVIDSLTSKALSKPVHSQQDAVRIRSQVSNSMLCDSEFLKMINGELSNDY